MGNHSDPIDQILREFENEDTEKKSSNNNVTNQNVEINLENLGIHMNQEGLKSPRCRKAKVKEEEYL